MKKYRLHRFEKQIAQMIILFSVFCFLFSVIGCEAFVRKFRRKPKKKRIPAEEMVLIPEEYPSLFASKKEEYRQYFLFWKSWQDEFINSLLYAKSHKKQMTCLDEAIKNLIQFRGLILAKKQKNLDEYIKAMKNIRQQLSKDTYTTRATHYRNEAEKIKRNVLRHYCYPKVKDYLR